MADQPKKSRVTLSIPPDIFTEQLDPGEEVVITTRGRTADGKPTFELEKINIERFTKSPARKLYGAPQADGGAQQGGGGKEVDGDIGVGNPQP